MPNKNGNGNGKSAAEQLLEKVFETDQRMEDLLERFTAMEVNQERLNDLEDTIMRNFFSAQKRKDELDSEKIMLIGRLGRRRELRSRHARIETLMKAMQEVTDLCPCGKHKGIKFTADTIDGVVTLEENMCPVHWWRQQHQIAFSKKDKSFLENNHLEEYLKWYAL